MGSSVTRGARQEVPAVRGSLCADPRSSRAQHCMRIFTFCSVNTRYSRADVHGEEHVTCATGPGASPRPFSSGRVFVFTSVTRGARQEVLAVRGSLCADLRSSRAQHCVRFLFSTRSTMLLCR